MGFDRKNLFRGALITAATVAVAALAFAASSSTPSNKGLRVISAVGNATAASADSCPNITCAPTDTCNYTTLTGTGKGFNRFGGSLGNSPMIACISTDTSTIIPNGNDGTSCSPSSGTAVIGTGSTLVTLSMAGQTCTVPGTSLTDVQVFNETWAVGASTDSKVGRGSGSFNAFANTTSGDGSFNVAGNFSAGTPTSKPSSTPTSTASSSGSPTPSGSPTASSSASPSASPTT